jgi:hypothetical protein
MGNREFVKSTKLCDINEGDHPSQRGDEFRSRQVFVCPVCASRNNRVVMGGFHGCRVCSACPNMHVPWHRQLARMVRWSKKPHPKSYREELGREIETMRRQHQPDVRHDLEGDPDEADVREVTHYETLLGLTGD